MDAQIYEHFGFDAADDVEGVLATLAPDVAHDIVGWPSGPTRGVEGARPFYETLFADLSDGRVETVRRLYGEDFLIDESLWRGRPLGGGGRDRPLEFRLLHVIEYAGDGRMKAEQVWIDLAAIQQQLPQ